MITSDPKLTGTVTNSGGSVDSILIEVDLNNDGVFEDTVITNSMGVFTFDPSPHISYGTSTVQFRTVILGDPNESPEYGNWMGVTFTWQAAANNLPVVNNLHLVNDDGTSNTDKVTTDGTISGQVSNDGSVAGLMIEIDFDSDGIPDATTETDAMGNFAYDTTPNLTPGVVTVQFRAIEIDPNTLQTIYGEWQSITFTLVE